MKRIHYSKPSITSTEIAYVEDAIRNGWGDHCYDYIARFEKEVCSYLGVEHAIATSSCTGALHMGLSALGVGPGDEVILGDINWIATAAPITYLGARPIFVDVLPDTWCLDPKCVDAAITKGTKAIIAVHLYGNLCDMDTLREIAKKRGVALIEDAAEAIGSCWHGENAGSMGTFGTFSFHGTKTVTTGEGGMFVTRDAKLYERVLSLSNHGRVAGQTRQFWPDMIGFKYKMSNVQAAIGCGQLDRIQELLRAKRRIFMDYQRSLEGLPIRMNPEPVGTTNGFWMPTLVVDPHVRFERQALLQNLQSENIDGRVFFWPLSSLPMFEPIRPTPVSYSIHARACNLPSYHDMTSEDVARVCGVVRRELA